MHWLGIEHGRLLVPSEKQDMSVAPDQRQIRECVEMARVRQGADDQYSNRSQALYEPGSAYAAEHLHQQYAGSDGLRSLRIKPRAFSERVPDMPKGWD